jgi:threonine dehydrogenase-like Zn-dependent dehydrogenase
LHQPLAACRVVVLGGGAIGLAAALVARLFGARDLSIGETNSLRRETVTAQGFIAYEPGGDEPSDNSVDLVIDAVGADATRATASRLARPGGVIVHVGLLPGQAGLDIRKITLQEITVAGVYCYSPADFAQTVDALAAGHLGQLDWTIARPLSEGSSAFAEIDAGTVGAAKVVLTI